MSSIHLKIKELVETKRLKQKEFAEMIGKTEQTVRNYFSGRTKIDIDVLQDIAVALDVPVSFFFEENKNITNVNYSGNLDKAKFFQNNVGSTIDFSKKKTDKETLDFIDVLKKQLFEADIALNELKSKYNEAIIKNKDLNKDCETYWEMLTYMVDFTTTLFIKAAESDKKIIELLSEGPEMRRFINQIKTISGLSENTSFFNQKFLKIFENPKI